MMQFMTIYMRYLAMYVMLRVFYASVDIACEFYTQVAFQCLKLCHVENEGVISQF